MSETKHMPYLDLGEVTDGEGRSDPMQGYITIGEGDEQTEIELRGLGAAKTAKQIVRAVNAHDELVTLVEWLVENDGECIGDHPKVLDRARAALSKARGQS